jgi:hypothetical protein
VDRILDWADAYHAVHGTWPAVAPGTVAEEVPGAPGEFWEAIDQALALGLRGMPGDSSLARLLAIHRGVALAPSKSKPRVPSPERPQVTLAQILVWADAHHAATRTWPRRNSGAVQEAPFEITWCAIDQILRRVRCDLPQRTTLLRVLAGQRDLCTKPALTERQILTWADAHHAATGRWPGRGSGKVLDDPGESWSAICACVRHGGRGLPGGSTLAQLLKKHRSVIRPLRRSALSIGQILAWADAHHAATGKWPTIQSGPVRGALDNSTWSSIHFALTDGHRGLPGGVSLKRLLRTLRPLGPMLSIEQILAWADAHHEATGVWPTESSGDIPGAPVKNWASIALLLQIGGRGLPGGQSLAGVIAEYRCPDDTGAKQPLCVAQILAWADAYHRTHGAWPDRHSGPVDEEPGETWRQIATALITGARGLATFKSLTRLLQAHRIDVPGRRRPRLTVDQILAWADAHHEATGQWPNGHSGLVGESPGERWNRIEIALRRGQRGLPGGSSLARLLAGRRGLSPGSMKAPLTLLQIVRWAEAHRLATGRWPTPGSGAVAGTANENWGAINQALRRGDRGLPGGLTLNRLAPWPIRNFKRSPADAARKRPRPNPVPGSSRVREPGKD